MSEQVSAEAMPGDQALNPQTDVTGSGQDLESMVLSWSISSVKKELVVSVMHEIDDLSPSDYLKSFKEPLIEETRTKIHKSLESISESPYYELVSILPTVSQKQSYLDVGTSYRDHIAEDGDLFLLSDQEPKELKELSDNSGENVHIWNALHMDIKDSSVMKFISSPSLIPKEICKSSSQQGMKASDPFIDLSEEQQQLAARIISSANCDHTQSINIVWGFAGTGKTKVTSTVLAALLHAKMRMVICGANTLHCSTLISYLCKLIKRSEQNSRVGDMLLLCDMSSVNDATKEYCLEWRIKEIMPCMLWRSKMQNLISFLEKDFKEINKGGIKGLLSVSDLSKQQFRRKSQTLVKMLMTLEKYSPSNIFTEEVNKELACFLDAAERFNETLANKEITDEDIMKVFGIYNPAASQAKHPRKKFSSIKNPHAASPSATTPTFVEDLRRSEDKCLKHLKCLEKRLDCPYEKDIEWIRRYLIKEVNQGSRFSLSLFERLISLGVGKHMLSTQYRMHPDICCFPNTQFYEESLSSAHSVQSDEIKLRYTNFMFVNVDHEATSDDAIIFLINTILQDWVNPSTKHDDLKLDIGVICPAKKTVQEHGPINLSIQSIDEIEAKEYDILIIAAYGLPNNKNVINYTITRAKKYLWIIGNEMELAASSTWKSLIDNAKRINYPSESTSYSEPSATIKNLSSQDLPVSTHGTISNNKTPFEFTWLGRPHNGKLLLPPVRDQRGQNHCTFHSSLATMEFLNKHRSASLVPAEDFIPTFSTCKLLAKYTKKHGEFGKETSTGRKRLENVLDILQREGAISKLDNTVHKLSSFHQVYDSRKLNQEGFLEAAARKPREGNGMVGSFPLSRNYSEYRPGDIYMFDPERPILTPKSRKPTSHAVILIGAT